RTRRRHRWWRRRRQRPRPGRDPRAGRPVRRRALRRPSRRWWLRAARPSPGDRVSISVLIVDDQALVRTGFRMILEAEADLEVVGEAGDGLQAIDEARRLHPDVILMDVRMPELDGIEATRRLLENGGGDARVVMLTTFDMDEYGYDALRAGASGPRPAHVARARGTASDRPRHVERGDRGRALRQRDDGEDARRARPDEAE